MGKACYKLKLRKPIKFWETKEGHRKYFDWLYTRLGYKSMEDWYNLTQEYIFKNGGRGLLTFSYGKSPSLALQSVYPEHHWQVDRFKHKPLRFWENIDQHKLFFEKLANKLGYKDMDDWYNVTAEDIQNGGG